MIRRRGEIRDINLPVRMIWLARVEFFEQPEVFVYKNNSLDTGTGQRSEAKQLTEITDGIGEEVQDSFFYSFFPDIFCNEMSILRELINNFAL